MAFLKTFRLNKIFKRILKIDSKTIFLYSALVGLISGLTAVLFHEAVHNLLLFANQLGTENTLTKKIFYFLLPALGGLVTGLIIYFFGDEAKGGGTDLFLDSFHNHAGILKKRIWGTKLISSIATLGTGGSGGKEGPMTLIGASIGSLFGNFIQMGSRARRTLLLAGAAGGLGAIFRTPLGGAITAVEVLYKEDFESDALIPCIISSVVAFSTFGSLVGFGHMLTFSSQFFHSPLELIFFLILALICTGFSYFFVRLFRLTKENIFDKMKVPIFLYPAIGGLFLSLLSLVTPEILGGGLGVLQQAIDGKFQGYWLSTCLFFLTLSFAKMLASSFTIQSGGAAGLLIPSFFIGGMLGGFTGTFFHHFFPELVPTVTPFIIVGMASFFSSMTKASLGALVMVTELTGGYELLPPLMLVAVVSLVLSSKWSIYENQAENKFSSKAHLWDMSPGILKNIAIGTAFDKYETKCIITEDTPLRTIKKLSIDLNESEFLVKSNDDALVGYLSLNEFPADEDTADYCDIDNLIVAKDLVTEKIRFLTPKDNLLKAVETISLTQIYKLPIIDNKKLVGYLTKDNILVFYNLFGNMTETNEKIALSTE